jgi:hypothetical protein
MSEKQRNTSKYYFFITKIIRMKTWLYLLTIIIAISIAGTVILNKKNSQPSFFNAIQRGNAKYIAQYFNQSVNLNISNKSDIYNKKQAQIILNNFFQENKIQSFQILEASENKSSNTITCKIINQNNTPFELFLSYYYFNKEPRITNLTITSPGSSRSEK